MPECGRGLSRLMENLVWPETVIGSRQDVLWWCSVASFIFFSCKRQGKGTSQGILGSKKSRDLKITKTMETYYLVTKLRIKVFF